MDNQHQSIVEFFVGLNVLVSGGSGFVGKVLVERLLRSCPGLGRLFLLIRAKRGQTPADRIQHYCTDPVFDKLRAEQPDFPGKLRLVSGDIASEGLGLSPEDRATLTNHVQVVFHCAANVRFDQPLSVMVNINTAGCQRMLDLAKEMTQLMSFIHVSTAYCQIHVEELEEKLYPPPCEPHSLINIFNWVDKKVGEAVTPVLMKGFPNTYSYSKCLSEGLVAEFGGKFPIGVARPSIVANCWKEPIPGWNDSLGGVQGVVVAAGKGLVHSLHCHPNVLADLVPVDIVVNQLIMLAWHVAKTRPASPVVLNITASHHNQIIWKQILDIGKKQTREHPFLNCLWCPSGSITEHRLRHLVVVVFLHFLPAYIIDGLLLLFGHKRFLLKIQRRVHAGLKDLEYFTNRNWKFRSDKVSLIRMAMSKHDQETFYSDMSQLKWDEYMLDSTKGARLYCLKEKLDTLPLAKKQMARLKMANSIVVYSFNALMLWLLYSFAMVLLNAFI